MYSEEDASSFGVVQALMVALSAQRVVSIDIKGERWPWSRADRNVPLAAMTQIGDCVLIKVLWPAGLSPADGSVCFMSETGLHVSGHARHM